MKNFLLLTLALVMLLASCTADNTSKSSESSSAAEGTVIETALGLIDEEKYKEAYTLLYQNRNDETAKDMFDDFTVVHTNVKSTSYYTYNYFMETEYNEHGDTVREYQKSFYQGYDYIIDYRYEYTYDESGKMLTCTRISDGENYPDKKTVYVYDESGNLIKAEETNGNIVENGEVYTQYYEYKYDENNNKTYEALTDPEGNITYYYSYSYDENGILQTETYYNNDTNNCVTEYTYNEQDILIKEVEKESIYTLVTEHTINDQGYTIKTVKSKYNGDDVFFEEHIYEYTYDEAGRIIEKVTYYPNDEIDTETFTYNEHGDIVKEVLCTSVNYTEIKETEYVYDENGNITKETIEKNAFRQNEMQIEYDSHGNKIRETVGDNHNYYEYTYDESGNIATMLKDVLGSTDMKTEYTYDKNGNTVKTVKYNPVSPDNKDVVESEFDENGNEIKVIDSMDNGRYVYTTLLTYDEHGNVLTRKQTDDDGDVLAHVAYTREYDESGNIVAETIDYKEVNIRTVNYTYKYDDNGNRINATLYNEDGTVYSSTDVIYDDDGNITERITSYPDTEKVPNTEKYTYDELGNVISEFRHNEALSNNIEATFNEYSDFVYFYTPLK